jgi:hypothetical protein
MSLFSLCMLHAPIELIDSCLLHFHHGCRIGGNNVVHAVHMRLGCSDKGKKRETRPRAAINLHVYICPYYHAVSLPANNANHVDHTPSFELATTGLFAPKLPHESPAINPHLLSAAMPINKML